jgi:hypothetical protein
MTKINSILSLVLLGLLISLIACKKTNTTLGTEVYDEDLLLDARGVDTFSIVAYSELIDTTVTANARLALLGAYNDPIFGKVSAGFFTQVRLAANNPSFGDLDEIIVDSVVLAMEFRDQYGPGNYQQDFAVYRLTENLSSDSLYRNNSFTAIGESLMAEGFSSFTPNNRKPFIQGNDTLPPQLRLRLKNSLGHEIINSSAQGQMLNNTVFLEFFKGLYVCTENANISPNSGAVYGLDLLDTDSKMIIYYRQGEIIRSYDLVINTNSARYNRVLYDYSGTRLEQLLLNPSLGNTEFYAQTGNVRAVVRFPTVQNLGNKTVIHRATLYLPYQYFNGDDKYPSPFITVLNRRAPGDAIWGLGLFNGTLAPVNHPIVPVFKRYTIDVTSFIQGLVKQSPSFTIPELMIVGSRTNDNVERTIFNGIESSNKFQPKLIITYTEF